MSMLALLVVLLLVLVGVLFLGGLAYAVYRHPRLNKPFAVAGTWAAVLLAAVGVILTR
jgi:predicted secreted Zn-dependent protease